MPSPTTEAAVMLTPEVRASQPGPQAPPQPLDLPALARRITELPPLPRALAEVLRLLSHDELSAGACVRLIEQDQALAAGTLRLANSAFYGAAGRVSTIDDAVRLLGLRTVACTLTAVSLRAALAPLQCTGFRFEPYWCHALAVAIAARELARQAGQDPDEAFMAGLMHDVGQLVLAAFRPLDATRAITLARDDDIDAPAAEIRVLGITHAELGALVAGHWRFPPSITLAIAQHHSPSAPAPGERATLAGLVHVADAMVHALDLDHDPNEAVPALDTATWQALQLTPAQAQKVFCNTVDGLRAMNATSA